MSDIAIALITSSSQRKNQERAKRLLRKNGYNYYPTGPLTILNFETFKSMVSQSIGAVVFCRGWHKNDIASRLFNHFMFHHPEELSEDSKIYVQKLFTTKEVKPCRN